MKKSNIECLKEWIDKTTPAVPLNRKQRRMQSRMLIYSEFKNKIMNDIN